MAVARLELEPLQRVSRRHPCPVCGRGDWCGYNSMVTVCMRVPSPYPARNGGWVHRNESGIRVGVSEEPVPAAEPAPVAVRDRVYRDLLGLLSLDKQHRDDLVRRGLKEKEIREMYRSVPPEPWVVARELRRMGHDLSGIPGFYRKQGRWGWYWTFSGKPGYFIPVRDVRGRIQALQVRVDESRSGGKYRMFSSSGRPGGSCSGTPAHVARPSVMKDRRIWVTEGTLKANLAAHFLGAVVVGAVGATCWKPVLPVLEDLGTEKVVLAFDRDQETNPAVARAVSELEKEIRKEGLRVLKAFWPREYKGIDDALAAGVNIRVYE
ncbi:MAG: DUF3854 domain-containing protein [Peptococcaceae bacterium]|nr:DUF3854 domain-containing protein [Peptococcaceae bacterium]